MAYQWVGSISPERCRDLAARAESLDLRPGPEGYRATPFEATRALFQAALADVFRPTWTYAIVVALAPGASLSPHVDGPIQGLRHHTVLQTTPETWVFHGEAWQRLALGGIYTMDPTVLHGAVNWGTIPRLHLVVDVLD